MSESICPICLDLIEENSSTSGNCDHMFCDCCLSKYIKNKIWDDRELNIKCPIDMCDEKITETIINELSDVDTMERYWNLEKLVGGIHVMCPTCNRINGKEDNNLHCYCSNCCLSYCHICQSEHSYYESECPNQDDIENELNDIKLASENDDIKICPICKIIISRDEGCNSMKCKNCKIKFCWNCLRTKLDIDINGEHDCDNFGTFNATNSDDEYTDGPNTGI